MLFHYTAVDEAGKMTDGELEGDNLNGILHLLNERHLHPVSVKPIQKARFIVVRLFDRITVADKVFLTKYLALMLKVGTDLLSAINILLADFDKPVMKDFLLEVRDNLTRGEGFYVAFAKHPKAFSPTFVSLIKAAEQSGNLERTFEDLSGSLEKEAELRNRVKSALIYPIVLLCASFAIMVFLVTFALPKVAGVFTQSGINPPFFSAVVFGVGLFVGAHIWGITIGLAVLIACGALFVNKTEVGKRMFDTTVTNLPVIRNIYRELAIQRMASTMSSLMKAGLPIVQTITVAAETVGLRTYKAALLRVANDGLAKGLTLGEAFKREQEFPKLVSNLVAISEKAGHLEEVLATLSDFYSSSVDGSIKALVSLLEPALLLTMGIIVAVIALSIIVPIYQLTTQF